MMERLIRNHPPRPASEILWKPYLILSNAHDSSYSFLDIFNERRRGARGGTTDEEQDLLRAMFVFSTSGLDSMIKQMVKDALPTIIELDEGANVQFLSFVESKVSKVIEKNDAKYLSSIIGNKAPRDKMINDLVFYICDRSLQSKDELLRVAAYFNIPSKDMTDNVRQLQVIFDVRNQISHEMDVDLSAQTRNRFQRRKTKMIEYTAEIFKIADKFLSLVDTKLVAS